MLLRLWWAQNLSGKLCLKNFAHPLKSQAQTKFLDQDHTLPTTRWPDHKIHSGKLVLQEETIRRTSWEEPVTILHLTATTQSINQLKTRVQTGASDPAREDNWPLARLSALPCRPTTFHPRLLKEADGSWEPNLRTRVLSAWISLSSRPDQETTTLFSRRDRRNIHHSRWREDIRHRRSWMFQDLELTRNLSLIKGQPQLLDLDLVNRGNQLDKL